MGRRLPDRFEQANGARAGDVGGVLGHVETHPDVALRAEVVDLVGLQAVDELVDRHRVRQVPVMQEHVRLAVVRVLINGVEPFGVESGGATDQAVDFIAFAQKKFGKVRAVLSGDARDECFFRHGGVR